MIGAAPDAVTVARRDWLTAALALHGHRNICIPCIGRQTCPEYEALDVAELDAFEALDRVRRGEQP